MKTYNHLLKGAVICLAVWATACSEVSFAPDDPELAEFSQLPDGTIRENFGFNENDTRAKVDILFVVDNSASMAEEQAKLSTKLTSFIRSLARIDWQIGITTTDISTGPYGLRGSLAPLKGTNNARFITKSTPNYEQVFANNVVRDELINCNEPTIPCPSADERPLEALSLAIGKRATDNAGFFRTDADFVTVVLSDEDEASNGSGAISPSTVVSNFKAAFGKKSMTGFGIIVKPGDSACYALQTQTGGTYGSVAAAFANLTGGVTGSICDEDYGPTLAGIGTRVRELVSSINLRKMPRPDTIQLKIKPFDPDLTWEIDGQTIRFNRPPKVGTTITVLYMPF